MPADPNFVPPSGATQNEQGFWVLPSGDLAPGQATPGMLENEAMGNSTQVQYDAKGRPYMLVGGVKKYVSPAALGGQTPKIGGGVFHNKPTFNQDTGEWDTGLNWGNILSLVVAGVMTAGVATSLLGGSDAAAAAVETAASTGEVPAGVATVPVTAASAEEAAATTSAVASTAPEAAAVATPTTTAATSPTIAELAAQEGVTNAPNTAAEEAFLAGQDGSGSSLGTLGKIAKGAETFGSAISNASRASQGQDLTRGQENISGATNYYSTLDKLAQEEARQRRGALQDIYLSNKMQNPSVSPYNVAGPPQVSPGYRTAMSALEKQGLAQLQNPAQYGTGTIPKPTLSQFQIPPKSTLQTVGDWVGPALSTAGTVASLF